MAALASMPSISIAQSDLQRFGQAWIKNGQRLSRTPPESSGELGKLFDMAVGRALATMLGGIPIVSLMQVLSHLLMPIVWRLARFE